ncbi:MAG: hypothetical protein KatS3mg104_0227 [Phycisphaerae bacterium]|nr:MAG: hypothetical protein KatS3mg104_0227 [Phycisphaerae bacterium]
MTSSNTSRTTTRNDRTKDLAMRFRFLSTNPTHIRATGRLRVVNGWEVCWVRTTEKRVHDQKMSFSSDAAEVLPSQKRCLKTELLKNHRSAIVLSQVSRMTILFVCTKAGHSSFFTPRSVPSARRHYGGEDSTTSCTQTPGSPSEVASLPSAYNRKRMRRVPSSC